MNIPPLAKPGIPLPALLTRVVIAVLGLLLILSAGHGPAFSPSRIGLLAPVFFFMALWSASNAFVDGGRDDEFSPAMVRGLNGMGVFLMLGAFCAIVVQPSLVYLAANGFTEMRGARFDLSVENITILTVGAVLVLLARRGGKLKSKLDEFV